MIDRYSFLIGFDAVKSFSGLNQKLRILLRAADVLGRSDLTSLCCEPGFPNCFVCDLSLRAS